MYTPPSNFKCQLQEIQLHQANQKIPPAENFPINQTQKLKWAEVQISQKKSNCSEILIIAVDIDRENKKTGIAENGGIKVGI